MYILICDELDVNLSPYSCRFSRYSRSSDDNNWHVSMMYERYTVYMYCSSAATIAHSVRPYNMHLPVYIDEHCTADSAYMPLIGQCPHDAVASSIQLKRRLISCRPRLQMVSTICFRSPLANVISLSVQKTDDNADCFAHTVDLPSFRCWQRKSDRFALTEYVQKRTMTKTCK